MSRTQVFISYSHKNPRILDRLITELSGQWDQSSFGVWSDRDIFAGEKWKESIAGALRNSGVAILLVTPEFLASRFIKEVEIPTLLRQQATAGLQVLWIACSHCAYKRTFLNDFQCANDPSSPLDTLTPPKRNQHWVSIGETILKAASRAGGNTNVSEQISQPRILIVHGRDSEYGRSVALALSKELTTRDAVVSTDLDVSLQIDALIHLNHEILRSDVLVPIFTGAAGKSQMLEFCIRTAQEISQKQGRPRLLPVRAGYEGDFTGAFAVLNGGPEVAWAADAATRILELLSPGVTLSSETASLPPSGEPPAEQRIVHWKKTYLSRDLDRQLKRGIERGETIIRVKGGRQMGKSRLLDRGVDIAKTLHATVARTNFQRKNVSQLRSIDVLYADIMDEIASQLGFEQSADDFWLRRKTPNANLENFFLKHVLPAVGGQFVWVLDEVDRLMEFSYSDDFFALLRTWYNDARDPDNPWSRATILMAYATEDTLIKNIHQSPFNVGVSLLVEDFNAAEVKEFTQKCKVRLDADQVRQFIDLVGGHPFLVERGLEKLAEWEKDSVQDPFALLLATSLMESGPFGDHLYAMLGRLAASPVLYTALRAFLSGASPLSLEEFHRLRMAGILNGDSARTAQPRCGLYDDFLRRQLVGIAVGRSA